MCSNVQWNRKRKQKFVLFIPSSSSGEIRRGGSHLGGERQSRRKLISRHLMLEHLMDLFRTPPHDNDSVRWNWMLTNDKTENWHLSKGGRARLFLLKAAGFFFSLSGESTKFTARDKITFAHSVCTRIGGHWHEEKCFPMKILFHDFPFVFIQAQKRDHWWSGAWLAYVVAKGFRFPGGLIVADTSIKLSTELFISGQLSPHQPLIRSAERSVLSEARIKRPCFVSFAGIEQYSANPHLHPPSRAAPAAALAFGEMWKMT